MKIVSAALQPSVEPAAGIGQHAAGCTLFDNAPATEEGRKIGNAGSFTDIVGNDDHRRGALAADTGDQRPVDRLRIEQFEWT